MTPVDAPGAPSLDIQRADPGQENLPAPGQQIADEFGDLSGHRIGIHFLLFLWNDFGAEPAAGCFFGTSVAAA